MIRIEINEDFGELIFRGLFSTIFLGLGAEHIFSDQLIQNLMPVWMPLKRLISLGCGVLLLTGGAMILVGYRVHVASAMLSIFLILVTILVHGTALFTYPEGLDPNFHWLWDIYQRINFVKNLCLLGVCFHLFNHEPGRYSLDALRRSI